MIEATQTAKAVPIGSTPISVSLDTSDMKMEVTGGFDYMSDGSVVEWKMIDGVKTIVGLETK